jgi:hypothetical protein
MTERKLGFDRAVLGDKVVEETDALLTMHAVIARELVQDYPDGKAYKPAEELEKAAWTAEGRWVAIMEHPDTGLLTRRSDVKGKMSNVTFRKDIMDPKTKRPMVRGIQADITWFKDKVPAELLTDIKSGSLKDVSIGFTYEEDRTSGEWEGQHYDFAQRNIFIDHVVAPCPVGRCPSPYCGIGVDAVLEQPKVEVTESAEDCPICQRIEEVGLLESVKRLTMKFGVDVLTALDDDPPKPVIVPDAPAATPVEVKPVEVKPEDKPSEPEAKQPEAVEEAPVTLEHLIERAEELLAMSRRLNKK